MKINTETLTGEFSIEKDIVTIKGSINDTIKGHTIRYMAASPVEKRMSFSGSGLPYSSPLMAFDNSKNKGHIEVGLNNSFSFSIEMPSSYYTNLGTNLIPPSVYIKYNNGISEITIDIQLAEPVPYRMLTYPSTNTMARKNANFYQSILPLPVRTQEEILLSSSYPKKNAMYNNFWGLKPPV